MATSTQTISGVITTPGGSAVTSGYVQFKLSSPDGDVAGNESLPKMEESVAIGSNGSFTVELWPNTRGYNGTVYSVYVQRKTPTGLVHEKQGDIQVGESGPYNLSALLSANIPPASNTFYRVISQAEYYAAIQAVDDAQAWAESPTQPDGPGTKSAKTWAMEAEDSAVRAEVATPREFIQRSDLVAQVAGGYVLPDGYEVRAGRSRYKADAASTHLIGLPGWTEVGIYTPDHQGYDAGASATSRGNAWQAFLGNVAGKHKVALDQNIILSDRDRLTVYPNGGNCTIDMRNFEVNWASSVEDGSGNHIMAYDRRSVVTFSGSVGPNIAILSIAETVEAMGRRVATIEIASTDDLYPGRAVFISSNDALGPGYATSDEYRGQHATVEQVIDGTHFTIIEPLLFEYITSPKVQIVNPVENVTILNANFVGGGRRPVGSTMADGVTVQEEGDSGISFNWARNCKVINPKMRDVDYNCVRFDNSVGCHVEGHDLTFAPKGNNDTIQYGVVFINACQDCSVTKGISLRGKHVVSFSRNSAPGIAVDCYVAHNVARGTWHAAFGMHGNSVRSTIHHNKAYNCQYAVEVRAPNWRVTDNYGENCTEVLRLTNNPRDLFAQGNEGFRCGWVVRLAKSSSLIGSVEVNGLTILDTKGALISQSVIAIEPTLPYLTEVDAEVTASTSNTVTVGAFGTVDNVNWDVTNALQGKRIFMDADGAGSGTSVSRSILDHTYNAGTDTNTLRVSGWPLNPIPGTATYVIDDDTVMAGLTINGVYSADCAGHDVVVSGAWKSLLVTNIHVTSTTNLTEFRSVWINGTVRFYPENGIISNVVAHNKGLPLITSLAVNLISDVIISG